MIRNLRLLGSLLVLLVLFAACGDEDDPAAGSDPGSPTATETIATTDASSTAETTPSATETAVPPTPTVESTATSPPAPPPAPDVPEYGWLTAWDAKWEGLGAMVLGPDGLLYIDDHVRHQLMVFDTDGSEQPPLAYESLLPEFVELRNDFAIGQDGRIYLLEQSGTARVLVLESDGTEVAEWGGTVGFDEESLFDARTIVVTPDGHVFTSRPGLLQKFTIDGEFVAAWDRAGDYLFPAEVYDMEVAGGSLYVAATGYRDDESVILTLDFDGNLVAEPIVVGEPDDESRIFPASLAIGPDGNLFIADPFTREIIVLSPAGEELTRWSLDPTEQRFPVVEVAVDDAGRVYVADAAREAIIVFATDTGNTTEGPRQEPSLAAIPQHAPCGMPVDVIGKGFEPNARVTLAANPDSGNAVQELIVTVDAEGVFTAEFPPAGEVACSDEIGLEGVETTIDAMVGGELIASAPLMIYPFDRRAGLQLSASEVGCGDTLALTGVNFEPGSDVVVTVGVEGGHQPVVPGQVTPVSDDGGFELELDISQFGPCLSESFDEPQEYIIWVATDRAKAGSAPTSYPSQRATITLQPPFA